MASQDLMEELYFGGERVCFAKIYGSSILCCDSNALELENEDEKAKQSPAQIGGVEMPFLPARRIVQTSSFVPSSEGLPPILSRPLLKTEWKTNLTGTKSGIRSAIIHHEGHHYRLKGCGNQDDKGIQNGFIVRVIPDDKEGKKELRGSCFYDLCLRELYMTAVIREKFEKMFHNFTCANSPLGYFHYETSEYGDPFPEIPKYCGVFETVGDRRAGDDLLCGLGRLLPLMLSKSYDINILKNTFDPSRIEGNEILPTWMACATCGMPPQDIVSFSIPEVAPDPPPSLHSKWAGVWGKCQEILGKYYGKKEQEGKGGAVVGNLLAFMYWKIGWDCGEALRGLHKGGISWGTYTDTLGTHSNGHVNNMVVLPPSFSLSSTNHLLYPLDYDMAYLCETFKEGEGGKVEENLAVEVNSMRMSLSGGDLNTGAMGTEGWEGDCAVLGAALLDTALAGFDCAFEGKEDPHPVGGEEKELMEAAVAVTQLALILSL
uniref:Uncharacterized protein n=1 Tax=Paramoeba aestuarina TaxID=180227 RepID=A0A7S4PJF2_9EUKA|mmetsp:Transcript_7429/g.11187  ORF Transcript_7429/g.11187 Transcript_7429/m.11187 type:complete len:489 (+) Transcript_7429:75-1541(+)